MNPFQAAARETSSRKNAMIKLSLTAAAIAPLLGGCLTDTGDAGAPLTNSDYNARAPIATDRFFQCLLKSRPNTLVFSTDGENVNTGDMVQLKGDVYAISTSPMNSYSDYTAQIDAIFDGGAYEVKGRFNSYYRYHIVDSQRGLDLSEPYPINARIRPATLNQVYLTGQFRESADTAVQILHNPNRQEGRFYCPPKLERVFAR